MIAELDLLTGKNIEYAKSLLEEIRNDLLEQIRPLKFNQSDTNSILHKREESFERLCFNLRKNNIADPENLNTYSFYKTVELIQEQQRTNK
jgi:hypothetical protein